MTKTGAKKSFPKILGQTPKTANEHTKGVSASLACAAPTSVNKPVMVGDVYVMPTGAADEICELLETYVWPVNARYNVPGLGTCVGATYDLQVARLGRLTMATSGLIKHINAVLKEALGGRVLLGIAPNQQKRHLASTL